MPTSWLSWKKSLVCKSQPGEVHDPQSTAFAESKVPVPEAVFVTRRLYRSGCSRSIANLRDVIHGSKRIERATTNFSPRSLESSDFIHSTTTAAHQAILRGQHYINGGGENVAPKLSLDHEGISDAYHGGCSARFGHGTPLHHQHGGAATHQSPYATPPHHNASAARGSSSSLMRFSGCYDCKNPALSVVVYKASSSVSTTSPHNNGLPPVARPVCQRCGEVFPRYEALQQHHLLKHAVTELEVGESSRNVVEIIFRTSWALSNMQQQVAAGNDVLSVGSLKIERVIKVNNLPKTLARFEDYREGVKARAAKLPKRHVRCLADGNELLRFYAATLECGLAGQAAVCGSGSCAVCRIIRHGFADGKGATAAILTTATSGRAHHALVASQADDTSASPALSAGTRACTAMLVCRVIAGRVHKPPSASGDAAGPPSPPAAGFDSVAGSGESASSAPGAAAGTCKFEELSVFNPRAILPCFVVIYKC